MAENLTEYDFCRKYRTTETYAIPLERRDETNIFILIEEMGWGVEQDEWLRQDSIPGDYCMIHQEIRAEADEARRHHMAGLFIDPTLQGQRIIYQFSDSRAAMAFKLRWG